MTLKRRTKRGLWVVGIVVAAWSAVNLALPRLEDGPRPALLSHALAGLRAHALSVCWGYETFGYVTGSATLQSLAKSKVHGDRYILKVVSGESGAPAVIIAYPMRNWGYEYGFVRRILTLDMKKHSYPTLVLMPDGSVYEHKSRDFHAENVPPEDVLVNVRDSGEWVLIGEHTTAPPCLPPKPEGVGG